MASAHKDSKGWRILYIDADGNRRTLRPGPKFNKTNANKVAGYVDALVAAKTSGGTIERRTAEWLTDIGDALHAKLVKAGLTEPKQPVAEELKLETDPKMTLAKFLDEHLAEGMTARGDAAKPNTLANWKSTMRFLKQCFDAERPVEAFTHQDGHAFRKWLDGRRIKKTKQEPMGQPMAENGKRKHVDNAKVFFNAAKRRGLTLINPFEHQVSSTKANRSRDYHLTRPETEKIIAACPDAQWKLLIALWRYAGLRKTEVFNLTWDDVLWDQGKMRVHASKTAHHEGKDIRYVPLRDIEQYLDAVDAEAAPGTVKIITRFSRTNTNLDKPLKKILHHAGLVPWPKLFQNMRASCETDWLDEGHPAHVVAAWIGHSVKVQRANYAQITDGHFEAFNNRAPKASTGGNLCGNKGDRNTAKRPKVATQAATEKSSKNTGTQRFFSRNAIRRVPEAGLEPARDVTPTGF